MKRIDLEVSVAGRSFPPSSFAKDQLTTTFVWDGTDAYGRLLQGAQPITVRVGNTYDGTYQNTGVFGYNGNGIPITASTTRKEITLWKVWKGSIGGWDKKPVGLGGWGLNVHHAYDPAAHTIHYGDGSDVTPQSLVWAPGVIQTMAGISPCNLAPPFGDEGPATAACLGSPEAVAVGPDGSVYIAERSCVRRVTTDGTIHTFAGQCDTFGFSGDEGPAAAATFHSPRDLAIGPDGSVYVADFLKQRIRRVDPSGVIHTVAGGGPAGQGTGDGGPATQATVNGPWGVDVTSDGTIYIADINDSRIRRVGPDGIIQTVAGTGNGFCESSNYGHPATTAHLCAPTAVRAANDGSFYLTESNAAVVDRVGPDGIITLVAGTGVGGHTGDGGPATSAAITARDLAIGPDGTLTILGNTTIRHIDSLGMISTVLGIENNASSTGDNGPPASATITSSDGIRIGPDGTLYVADKNASLVRRVQPALPGFAATGTVFPFASQDGTQVHVFDPNGRHLKTLDAFTGAVIYEFTYDSVGRLSGVFDIDRNLTRIAHDPSGHPTSIAPRRSRSPRR